MTLGSQDDFLIFKYIKYKIFQTLILFIKNIQAMNRESNEF